MAPRRPTRTVRYKRPVQEEPPPKNPFEVARNKILEESQSGGKGPPPIGVGRDFTAAVQDTRREEMGDIRFGRRPPVSIRQQPPRYFKDMEFAPANFHPSVIARIQQDLAAIGFYDTNDEVIPGDWGPDTAAAFKRLLGYSNQHGTTWQTAMARIKAAIGQAGGPGGGTDGGGGGTGTGGGGRFRIDENGDIVPIGEELEERAPLVARTTDPRTVELVMREAAMNLLGEGLSSQQVADLRSTFNNLEVQRQQAAYDAQLTGGTVVDIPSPEAFGQAEIESRFPEQTKAWRMTQFGQNALQLLASPAWGIE